MPRIVPFEKSVAFLHPHLKEQWSPKNEKDLSQFTPGSHHRGIWVCGKPEHEWPAMIYSRVLGAGCPYCSGRVSVGGPKVNKKPYKKKAKSLKSNTSKFNTPKVNTPALRGSIRFTSSKKLHGLMGLRIFLNSFELSLVDNSRKLDLPHQAQFIFPELKVGFDYIDDASDFEYFLHKTKICKENGLNLFFVWDFDWTYYQEQQKGWIKEILK